MYINRLVEKRRTSAFLTVNIVPLYAIQFGASTVCLKIRCLTVQYGATVQHDFDRNLAVWLQFWPKTFLVFLQQLVMNKTQIINQELSTASDFEFPCKPLLCALPRADVALTQPQGRSGTHCVAPAHKGSMLEVDMGGV